MIGQQQDPAQAQLMQDLRADTIVPVQPVAGFGAGFPPADAARMLRDAR